MNGVYLFFLLKELRPKLERRRIVDFSQRGRLIQLMLDRNSLFISLYPEARAVFLGPKEKEDFRRVVSFYNILRGAIIQKVEQQSLMPVFRLHLTRGLEYDQKRIELVVSLYYSGPNIGYRLENTRQDLYARFIEKEPKVSLLELEPAHLKAIEDKTELVKRFDGIDKSLARELTPETLEILKQMIGGARVQPKLVKADPLQISLFGKDFIKEFSSFNEIYKFAVREYLLSRTQKLLAAKRERMRAAYRRKVEKLKAALLSQDEVEEYRIKGELLLANLRQMRKGLKEVEVLNLYTQKRWRIQLDPSKGPKENVQAYFAKYKKLKRSQPSLRKRIEELEREMEHLDLQIESKSEKEVRPVRQRLPYHKFVLDSGSIIYVGKNARSNEFVSFKLARPDDYIFHTRAYEGAHTILRIKNARRQNPSKKELQIAASIAAYFSKARNQRNVPVSYTRRKFIKKNKKGGVGSIIFIREEVIFVDPLSPRSLDLGLDLIS